MKHQFEYPAPPPEGIVRVVFSSQGRIKAETIDPRQLLDPNGLSQNYFE